jgi:oxygen-independent coproporphyrinogen-3 oxidase
MANIYVHIPFCKSKCSYCDFYSIANNNLIDNYISALCKEIEVRKNSIKDEFIETIYFGGGTPSLLSITNIEAVLNVIHKNYNIVSTPEISFEANPESLNKKYLKDLYKLNINRLSIGIQSLNPEVLKMMNRKHSVDTAIKSVYDSVELGFNNVSVDLIYGIPNMSIAEWERMINSTLSLPITHLSAYHLSIEEGTLLHKKLKKGNFDVISDNDSFEQYKLLIKLSSDLGFLQYEISNFAKFGYESRHNSSYWNGSKYIGFGPSAHSFYQNKRFWNVSNVREYISQISNDEYFPEFEKLSIIDKINETIMLSLRTVKGLDLSKFRDNFGESRYKDILDKIKYINPKSYAMRDSYLQLTPTGMFISDKVIEILFFID